MAYTIYEYASVADNGEPIQPPAKRTESQANGAAVQLEASTVYVAVVADADMYLRISADGSAATDGDFRINAGDTKGFPVQKLSAPYVYGLAVT